MEQSLCAPSPSLPFVIIPARGVPHRGRQLSIDRWAGILLVGLPIAFNVFFILLGQRFDYPSVLRQPVGTILSRFHAGGAQLRLLWYGFMLTAVLLAPVVVLLGQVLARTGCRSCP